MSPDRLRAWLARKCPGGVVLRLSVEGLPGGEPQVVAEWPADEIADQTLDPVAVILDQAQEYVDVAEQSAAFLIQWVGADGRVLKTTKHRIAPTERVGEVALNADKANAALIVSHFMQHDIQKTRVLVSALGSMFGGFERTLAMQSRMLTDQHSTIQQLQLQLQAVRAARGDEDEDTEEHRTEALARAAAWEKFGDVGPQAAQLALAWLQNQMPGGADGGGNTNGSGH